MSEGGSSHVLIVDDTLENIQVLGSVLRGEGYRISVAQNGQEALETVATSTPDLILLDVMMPVLDGFETCQRLQADPATKDVPVIFLTAKAEAQDIAHGFELGAVDYVTKPFNSTELLARVRTHLKIQRLQHELRGYNAELEHKVAERTEQIREAHAILQRQVREMAGRDRLVEAQLAVQDATETYEIIVRTVAEVLAAPQVQLLLQRPGGLRVVAATGLAGAGVLQHAPELLGAPVSQLSSSTFADGKPRDEGAAAAVPLLYGDEVTGVIEVAGLEGDDAVRKVVHEMLWRLGREVSLALHSLDMNTRLESGALDVTDLLEIDDS